MMPERPKARQLSQMNSMLLLKEIYIKYIYYKVQTKYILVWAKTLECNPAYLIYAYLT